MKPGDLIAERYRLLRTIGEGGMGSVWAAHHELIARDVAVKVTGERLAHRPEIRNRFQNEARAVGKLRHPNIVDVMDVGELPNGSLYIVFELLQGSSLADQIDAGGAMAAGDAVAIAIEICRALEAAHAAGVVHRDLKPANIFLHRAPDAAGVTVKVLDFGISKSVDEEGVSLSMTQTGIVLGTPQYMSFEQARGTEDVDLRTDIWGVGAILYELISGRLPFEAVNYNAMLYKILHDDPPPLSRWGVAVAPELERVLARCLAKQRGQRYGSARELREALEATVAGLPATSAGLHIESSSFLAAAPFALGASAVRGPTPSGVAAEALASETLLGPPSSEPPIEVALPRPAPVTDGQLTMPGPAGRRPHRGLRAATASLLVAAALGAAWFWSRGRPQALRNALDFAAPLVGASALIVPAAAPAPAADRTTTPEPVTSSTAVTVVPSASARPPPKPGAPPRRVRPSTRLTRRPRVAPPAKLTNVENAGF